MDYSLLCVRKPPTAPVQLCTYGRRVGCGRLSAAQTRVCSWPVHTDYRTASRPASSSVRSSYSGACSPCRGSSQPSAPARRRAPVGLAGTPCSAGARAAPPPPRRPPHPPSPRRPASGSGRRRRRSWASRPPRPAPSRGLLEAAPQHPKGGAQRPDEGPQQAAGVGSAQRDRRSREPGLAPLPCPRAPLPFSVSVSVGKL